MANILFEFVYDVIHSVTGSVSSLITSKTSSNKAPEGLIASTHQFDGFIKADKQWYWLPKKPDITNNVWNDIQQEIIRILNSDDWAQWRKDTFNGQGDWSQDIDTAMFTVWSNAMYSTQWGQHTVDWLKKYEYWDIEHYYEHLYSASETEENIHTIRQDIENNFNWKSFAYPNLQSIVNPNQKHGFTKFWQEWGTEIVLTAVLTIAIATGNVPLATKEGIALAADVAKKEIK